MLLLVAFAKKIDLLPIYSVHFEVENPLFKTNLPYYAKRTNAKEDKNYEFF